MKCLTTNTPAGENFSQRRPVGRRPWRSSFSFPEASVRRPSSSTLHTSGPARRSGGASAAVSQGETGMNVSFRRQQVGSAPQTGNGTESVPPPQRILIPHPRAVSVLAIGLVLCVALSMRPATGCPSPDDPTTPFWSVSENKDRSEVAVFNLLTGEGAVLEDTSGQGFAGSWYDVKENALYTLLKGSKEVQCHENFVDCPPTNAPTALISAQASDPPVDGVVTIPLSNVPDRLCFTCDGAFIVAGGSSFDTPANADFARRSSVGV